MEERWIQTKSLYNLLELEPFILLSILPLLAWGFYKLFLTWVSEERHNRLKKQYGTLFRHYLILALLFVFFHAIKAEVFPDLNFLMPYFGVAAFFWGAVIFIRSSRLIVLQYLFMGSMQAGVPILIVNIFSLALLMLITMWGASQIFGFQVGPLIATSAAFSLILGLNGSQKSVGQVKEITWRATTLIGWTDEEIIIPNRAMASSQISNFHNGEISFVRSQIFRLPYEADLEQVKAVLLGCLGQINDVKKFPEPICFISETSESFITMKLVYYISRYGGQFVIGDKVLTVGWQALKTLGYSRAAPNVLQISSVERSAL
jgi:hypothetical protein